ncbi:MAG: hypothetical protein N3E51_01290 [Candidatus Micrarchaeota archaeon]|nr:hypothetical protein [Candidatus Micrarchaeota archaeon]
MEERQAQPERKIRLAYITSPRELEKEGVGSDSRIVPTLEYLQRAIEAGNPNVKNLEIAAVIVDDNGVGNGTGKMKSFQFLEEFCRTRGIAFHVEESSGWRSMPSRIEEGGQKVANPQKHQAKVEYERRLLSFLREKNIDLVLSDSYAVLFNSVMLDEKEGYRGLILNIHPGIASEVPGITPTADARLRSVLYAESRQEKHDAFSQLASGMDLHIRRNGNEGAMRRIFERTGVKHEFLDGQVRISAGQGGVARATTGATLHVVDELVDHGPAIITSSGTPIRKGDGVMDLRVRNYQTKNNAVVRGLGMFLRDEKTQRLVLENRMKNRAFNSDCLPTYGSLQARGIIPDAKKSQKPAVNFYGRGF